MYYTCIISVFYLYYIYIIPVKSLFFFSYDIPVNFSEERKKSSVTLVPKKKSSSSTNISNQPIEEKVEEVEELEAPVQHEAEPRVSTRVVKALPPRVVRRRVLTTTRRIVPANTGAHLNFQKNSIRVVHQNRGVPDRIGTTTRPHLVTKSPPPQRIPIPPGPPPPFQPKKTSVYESPKDVQKVYNFLAPNKPFGNKLPNPALTLKPAKGHELMKPADNQHPTKLNPVLAAGKPIASVSTPRKRSFLKSSPVDLSDESLAKGNKMEAASKHIRFGGAEEKVAKDSDDKE